MKRNVFLAAACTAVLTATIGASTDSHAIEKCRAKVDKKTGVIRIDASGVAGPLLWGKNLGEETLSFANAAGCIAGGTAKKCELADPASLAAKTPPSGCTVYLSDGATPCSVWIRGCSPAPREGAGLLWKDANGLTFGSADASGTNAVRRIGSEFFRVPMEANGSGPTTSGQVVFANSDCSGPALAYTYSALIKEVQYFGPGVPSYYATGTGTLMSYGAYLVTNSQFVDQAACDTAQGPGTTYVAPLSCCIPGSYLPDVIGPATSVDIGDFTAPFHLEAE